jgi:hypothetical protein
MRSLAEAKAKRVRAVELLSEGKSYDEIAREVGFTHRGSAHRAVSKALAERTVEAVDELRQIELDRLDRLQVSLWDRALDGDIQAVITILKITDQRIRIMGLQQTSREDNPPTALFTGPIS